MKRLRKQDRARVHLPDMIMATVVFVAAWRLTPVVSDLTGGVQFDPFTDMMLTMLMPFVFLLLIVSVGVSGVRAD